MRVWYGAYRFCPPPCFLGFLECLFPGEQFTCNPAGGFTAAGFTSSTCNPAGGFIAAGFTMVAGPRLSSGKFESKLPPSYLDLQNVLLVRGNGQEAYYRTAPAPYFEDGMLPKIHAAFGPVAPRRISPPFRPWAPGSRNSITRLLDFIGTILHPIAKRRTFIHPDGSATYTNMKGSDAFKYPLTREDTNEPVCMVYHTETARELKYIHALKTGYVGVALGALPGGVELKELAHRIVMWAIKGPPRDSMRCPVVMHKCNNKKCLNPMHMKWGEQAENMSM